MTVTEAPTAPLGTTQVWDPAVVNEHPDVAPAGAVVARTATPAPAARHATATAVRKVDRTVPTSTTPRRQARPHHREVVLPSARISDTRAPTGTVRTPGCRSHLFSSPHGEQLETGDAQASSNRPRM